MTDYFSEATKNDLQLIPFKSKNGKAVLRKRKPVFEGNTLTDEGKFMGFEYRVRSMPETASFTKTLYKSGIPVPEIFDYGDDFIIEEYIEGQPLSEILPQKVDFDLIEKFLNQIVDAHKNGLVIGERWGKNEILNSKGDIVFIDLDVEYICDFDKELELAEAINAIVCFSKNLEVSRWLRKWLQSEPIQENYDVKKIIWLLQKHIEFWGDEGDFLQEIVQEKK